MLDRWLLVDEKKVSDQGAIRDNLEGGDEEIFEGDTSTRVDEDSVGEESHKIGDEDQPVAIIITEGNNDEQIAMQQPLKTERHNMGARVRELMLCGGRNKNATDLNQNQETVPNNSVETEPAQIENKHSTISSDDDIGLGEFVQKFGIEMASSLKVLSNETISFLHGIGSTQETTNKKQPSPEEPTTPEGGFALDNSSGKKEYSTTEGKEASPGDSQEIEKFGKLEENGEIEVEEVFVYDHTNKRKEELTPGDSTGSKDDSRSKKVSGPKNFGMPLKNFLRKKYEVKHDLSGTIEQREEQEIEKFGELEDERDIYIHDRENPGIRDVLSYDPEEVEVEEVSVLDYANKREHLTMVSGTMTKKQAVRKEFMESEKSKFSGMGFMARISAARRFVKGGGKKSKKKRNKRAPLMREDVIRTSDYIHETSEQIPKDTTFTEEIVNRNDTNEVNNDEVREKATPSLEEISSSTIEGKASNSLIDPSADKEVDTEDNIIEKGKASNLLINPSVEQEVDTEDVIIETKSTVSVELQRKAELEGKNMGLIFSTQGLQSDSSWEDDDSSQGLITPRRYARMYLAPALSRDRSNPEKLNMLHSLANRTFSFGN